MDTKSLLGLVLALSTAVACSTQTDASDGEDDGAGGASQPSAWDAQSVDNEVSSTHLWIVNRGMDILAKHPELPAAKLATQFMNSESCKKQWQQGLLDADFKGAYNGGRFDLPLNPNDALVGLSGATWASHFYDPDTGKNYKGDTEGTALTEADGHLRNAFESGPAKVREGNAKSCYEIGLALHYFTDLTQPMHASNFTAVDRPAKLHSNLEGYATEIQARYPLEDWSATPRDMDLHDYVIDTAKATKTLWVPGVQAVVNAYKSREWQEGILCRDIDASPLRFIERQHIDHKACWAGDPGVDKAIGHTLMQAEERTAGFVYLIAKKAMAGDE